MSQTLRNIGDITYIIDNVYFFIGKLLINKSSIISTLRVDFFSHNLLLVSIKVKFKILQLQNFDFFRYAKLFIPRKSVWCKKKITTFQSFYMINVLQILISSYFFSFRMIFVALRLVLILGFLMHRVTLTSHSKFVDDVKGYRSACKSIGWEPKQGSQ